MDPLLKDLRYGLRMLAKNPGVSAIAVLTLALGIGANTAIFSVVSAVLLNPLPYKDPDRLVSIWENVPEHGRWRAAPANFFDWKKQNTVFENVAAFGGSTMTLTGDGEPQQLMGTRVSDGYFAVVGATPMLGRAFLPEEHEPGKDRVVILGHSLWQSRYGADQHILTRTVTLDGNSYTVVGVMPPGLYPVRPTTAGRIEFDEQLQDYWHPYAFTAQFAAYRSAHVLGVVARLKPGVTIAQAQAEMDTIGARLAQEHAANKDEGIIVNQFLNEVVGNVRPALLTLLVAVGLVLLIACANIAGLLLAQHAARTKEIAIRAALGAGRLRLVRQFFAEGLLLSLFGTVAGLLLAQVGLQVL
ncbi:MAG TPA: ABC transporter permease, partial [Pyrinomonadaceae bacterium]|nr:ABC transporter permease [Pyrinomonadaceae bacterium]